MSGLGFRGLEVLHRFLGDSGGSPGDWESVQAFEPIVRIISPILFP